VEEKHNLVHEGEGGLSEYYNTYKIKISPTPFKEDVHSCEREGR